MISGYTFGPGLFVVTMLPDDPEAPQQTLVLRGIIIVENPQEWGQYTVSGLDAPFQKPAASPAELVVRIHPQPGSNGEWGEVTQSAKPIPQP